MKGSVGKPDTVEWLAIKSFAHFYGRSKQDLNNLLSVQKNHAEQRIIFTDPLLADSSFHLEVQQP